MSELTERDRALLRQVFMWAHKAGWRPKGGERWIRETAGVQVEVRVRDWRKAPAWYVCVRYGGPDFDPQTFVRNVRGVQGVLDILAAVNVLPDRFSSAYAAGHRDGGDEVSADAIERGTEAQLDLVYSKFWQADAHRMLADLIEARPGTPPLAEHPYDRGEQIAQLCIVMAQFLEVDHDF